MGQQHEVSDFEIRGDTITLGQLIKVLGLAGSGAQVKDFLVMGGIYINDEPDVRRGRKIHPGDVVTFPEGTRIRISSTA